MRGQLVIVRAFGDQPLVRRVWATDKDVIHITDDLQLQHLVAGKEGLAVAFRKEDVFEYTPSLATKLKRIYKKGGKVDWRSLKRCSL